MEHWLERVIAQWVHHEGSIRRPIAPWANALTIVLPSFIYSLCCYDNSLKWLHFVQMQRGGTRHGAAQRRRRPQGAQRLCAGAAAVVTDGPDPAAGRARGHELPPRGHQVAQHRQGNGRLEAQQWQKDSREHAPEQTSDAVFVRRAAEDCGSIPRSGRLQPAGAADRRRPGVEAKHARRAPGVERQASVQRGCRGQHSRGRHGQQHERGGQQRPAGAVENGGRPRPGSGSRSQDESRGSQTEPAQTHACAPHLGYGTATPLTLGTASYTMWFVLLLLYFFFFFFSFLPRYTRWRCLINMVIYCFKKKKQHCLRLCTLMAVIKYRHICYDAFSTEDVLKRWNLCGPCNYTMRPVIYVHIYDFFFN